MSEVRVNSDDKLLKMPTHKNILQDIKPALHTPPLISLHQENQEFKNMAKVHLVFLPVWEAGHFTSMLEFAKKLLQSSTSSNPGFTITVLVIKPPLTTFSSATTSTIQSLSSSGLDIHFQELPPIPHFNSEGPEDFISVCFQAYNPYIKAAIYSSSTPVSAIFIDLFGTPTIDVANELAIPAYVYFTSSALMLGLTLHLPTLEETISKEFEEVEEGIPLPKIKAIPPLSMPTPMMNKKRKIHTWFVYHGRRYREAKGIIINTFEELEDQVLGVLKDGLFVPDCKTPPVYPVGPILSLPEGGEDEGVFDRRHECLRWLDQQPRASVVFLCFGSMGCFDAPQVKEMAAGLEKSGHRFLWILRGHPTSDLTMLSDANLRDVLLPPGFLDATKERGTVWPSWAPQRKILAHPSVGGFVTHCGWNSCLESLWFGVPMLAWPLYAEQHLNQVEMVRDLGIAVGLKFDRKNNNFVKGEELERGVRGLMGDSDEGRRVRVKVEEIRVASRMAVKEGGTSYVYVQKLAAELVGLGVE